MSTVILSCESLEVYVAAAQKAAQTDYPIIWLPQKHHENPARMRRHIMETLAALPREVDTVLVAMGLCGGSWDAVTVDKKLVIPRVDDCITLLLHTDDRYRLNLKQSGHMYMLDADPEKFSPERMLRSLQERLGEEEAAELFDLWFANYSCLDIVDTGLGDSHAQAYVTMANRCADLIGCRLTYTPGSTLLLEKLFSGHWDEQFLVAKPGHTILQKDFFA